MSRPDREQVAAVALACRERYLSELASGATPSLPEYLRSFAGFEDVVTSVFDALGAERPAAAADAPDDGDRVGPYQVLGELGRGGQGRVLLARDERLGREVALKLLPPGATAEQLQRLQREGAIAARIDDPGVCTVLEVGQSAAGTFVAMQRVVGATLAERIRNHGDLPPPIDVGAPEDPTRSDRQRLERALELVERVARSVGRMHEAGVLHRDLKPSNVMVRPDGHPVVLDFGLAHTEDPDHLTLTASGQALGTPAYMAPELLDPVRAATAGPATDVWALGVMLFECLTGERPFGGPTREVLVHEIRTGPVPSLRAFVKGAPRDLQVVVETALAKRADERYHSAQDLADELERVRTRQPVRAKRAGPVRRAQAWVRRHPTAAVTFGGLLLAATAVPSVLLLQERRASEQIAEREQVADANLARALDAIDHLLARVGGERLRYVPHAEQIRTELLEEALALYESLRADVGSRAELAFGSARTSRRLGQLLIDLGRPEEGLRALDRARDGLDAIAAPAGPVHDELSVVLALRAHALASLGRQDEAAAVFDEVRSRSADGVRSLEVSAAFLYAALARAETEREFRQFEAGLTVLDAVAEPISNACARDPDDEESVRQRFVLASERGFMLWHLGRKPEAEAVLREAQDLGAQLGAPEALAPVDRARVVENLARLSAIALTTDRPDEGIALGERAVAMGEELCRSFPGMVARHWSTVEAYASLGFYHLHDGRPDPGLAIVQRGVALADALLERAAPTPRALDVYVYVRRLLGDAVVRTDPALAEESYAAVLAGAREMRERFPQLRGRPRDVVYAQIGLGTIRADAGDPSGARDYFQEALRRLRIAERRRGPDPEISETILVVEQNLSALDGGR